MFHLALNLVGYKMKHVFFSSKPHWVVASAPHLQVHHVLHHQQALPQRESGIVRNWRHYKVRWMSQTHYKLHQGNSQEGPTIPLEILHKTMFFPCFSYLFFFVWSLTKTVHFCALLGPDLDQALFDESMCDSTMNIHEQHLLSLTNLPQACSNRFKWTISLRFAGQK